ncbi:MAG: two-component system VirA-like sensor kinase [Reyranella sp.]|uniref:two-component system VirA-like sensor kinase n=1 Tax=Reyranella sp. TaxID=1929291 RepID=UPI003D13FF38
MIGRIGRTAPFIAALLLVLTWLLVRSASPDPALHERTLHEVRSLLLHDAALHRDVLRARAGLLRNYDPLVQSIESLRDTTAALHVLGNPGGGHPGTAIIRQLDRLAEAVKEQEGLIETFKSDNAVLQNSLRYLNHATHQLGQSADSLENASTGAIGLLASAMLRFTGDPSGEAAADVTAALDRMSRLPFPPAREREARALVMHGRLVVAALPNVDGIVGRLLASPTAERARTLQDLYLDEHGRAAERAGMFRLLLYLAAVVLVACLGHLFYRLRVNARTLRERLAFENLIAEISAGFINLPTDRIAQGVEQSLARLAEGAGLDRAYILLRNAAGAGVERSHRWSRHGTAELSPACDEQLLAAGLHWRLPDHESQGCVHVPSVSALPSGPERTALLSCGICSWTCVPLGRPGSRIGLLGFDMTRREKRMADDDIALLRMVGEIFVNAIDRQHGETEREALEMRLRRAQRLEAVGTLAGGIAHNFNNILSAILGYTEMALAQLPRHSRTFRHVQEARNAGERARDIVDQILTFGRRVERRRQHVSMKPMVDEAASLLRASLPATIELHVEISDEDAAVIGDAAQLQQVVVNFCTNAAHAMHGRGVVALGLDTVTFADAVALSHGTVGPGRYVRLQVRDSGHGMDRATIERIFEPFFTTKVAGGGTGLGLATVHGIVADHGGVLNVRSQPGAGSRFEVYIAHADSPGTQQHGAMPVPLPTGRGQTILLVDDERPLVALGEEMLAALGYEPVGFDSGRAALAAFTTDPQRFDLVLADELMPAMTGPELALEVHRIRPEIPFVLMSGDARPNGDGANRIDRALAADACAVLRKPLSSSDIAQMLARHLSARPV